MEKSNTNRTRKKKKKLSGFKKFLIIYVAAFCFLATIFFIWFHGCLADYEEGQPRELLENYVSNFGTDTIEDLISKEDMLFTEFESADIVKQYFTDMIAGKEITYKEKGSEYKIDRPVYSIMAGDEEVAKVVLEENGIIADKYTKWKIGSVELSSEGLSTEGVEITAPSGAEIYLNGVKVADTYCTEQALTVEETKNLGDFSEIATRNTYKISGLIKKPEITAKLNGEELSVDGEDGVYTVAYPGDDALLAEITERVKTIYHSYGTYIINKGNLATLLSYSVGTAKTNLSDIPAVWAYGSCTYEFENEAVSELKKYSDNCVSVEIYFDLKTHTNSGDMEYPTSMTYVMVKQNDVWYLADFIQHKVETEANND